MPFHPEDYADLPPRREDDEAVYPDGTPKYECWNDAAIHAAYRRAKADRPAKTDALTDEERHGRREDD